MFTRIYPLLLLLVSGASAQQAPNLRVQSNVVLVPTLVKDAEGHIVCGLTQNDFVIEDDGVEQAVDLNESAESEPASVVVAVQTGRRAWREYSRMRGIGPMLTPVFDQLRSRVALVEFDSHVRLVENFSDDETSIYETSRIYRRAITEQQFAMPSTFPSACLKKSQPTASGCCSW
jgi:hypothetical protein